MLVTLPQATLPRLLGGFAVGGAVSQSVVLTTAVDSLVLIGIMAGFGAFNSVASHHELLAATPRAFHEPGLVLTVGLAFVPATLDAATAAREADRARTGGVTDPPGPGPAPGPPGAGDGTGARRAPGRVDGRPGLRPQPGHRWRTGPPPPLGTTALLALAGAVVALVGEAGARGRRPRRAGGGRAGGGGGGQRPLRAQPLPAVVASPGATRVVMAAVLAVPGGAGGLRRPRASRASPGTRRCSPSPGPGSPACPPRRSWAWPCPPWCVRRRPTDGEGAPR